MAAESGVHPHSLNDATDQQMNLIGIANINPNGAVERITGAVSSHSLAIEFG
jgi:hypothetical protein